MYLDLVIKFHSRFFASTFAVLSQFEIYQGSIQCGGGGMLYITVQHEILLYKP